MKLLQQPNFGEIYGSFKYLAAAENSTHLLKKNKGTLVVVADCRLMGIFIENPSKHRACLRNGLNQTALVQSPTAISKSFDFFSQLVGRLRLFSVNVIVLLSALESFCLSKEIPSTQARLSETIHVVTLAIRF